MRTSQWERARELFQRALEQPDRDRAAFLADACAGDAEIQREVEQLIAAHAAADGFLETPAFDLGSDAEPFRPALQPGDRLGPFEVLGVLGRGGMGEVYRARDARLGRDVAIKVLPRSLATDPQRLARFERESRMLASLNHPHIAAIHSVEQFEHVRLLVLELVEGPTLGDRLIGGPLLAQEALAVARDLAGALEAAHDRGIVHRDLKPANIKLATSSGIKLLDFGIAKAVVAHDPAAPGPAIGEGTVEGAIVGTWSYMSPEQARGKPVDKRTDIWAFGCLLFEMLTGTQPFRGDTPSDTVAAVLEREPDWSRLPPTTAPGISRLLRRCLEKDPARRLHDMADARIEIEDALSNREDVPTRSQPRASSIAPVALLCAAGIALGWWLHGATRETTVSRTLRFTWTLPADLGLDSPPTISPDGQLVVFAARTRANDSSGLYVRPIDQLAAQLLPGTEGARHPFWAPDSRSVAYFARGRLLKVALAGGAPVEISVAPDARGGAWSPNGTIVFAPMQIESGLMRVSESGGQVEPATLLDLSRHENSHRWPVFLPDGIRFLYFVRSLDEERRGVYVGRIDGPATVPGTALFQSESEALFGPLDDADRGVLLTVAGSRIEARPFDARRAVVTGDPRVLDLPAAGATAHHAMMLSVSADVMTYVASSIPLGVRKASIDRNGDDLTIAAERAIQGWPRLSPDGRQLGLHVLDAVRGRPELWIEDLVRGTRHRLSSSPFALASVWSPDGERVAHLAESIQKGVVTIATADGTRVVATVGCPEQQCDPTDWSRDGRWLLATVYKNRDRDVWMLPADGQGTARPLFAQSFAERDARFSPNGRLVAYVSEETGRPEVSVHRIDGPPRRDVISVSGGDQPVWSRDGRELFFVDPQGLLRSASISMAADGRPIIGTPVRLDMPPIGSGHWGTQYDVSPDGRRIYFFDRRLAPAPSEFGVVVGWRALVK
jgi:serine/threonine protein kinase/Tol biopolymer transport system component